MVPKKFRPEMETLLKMKQEVFENFASDLHEMYKKGRFRLLFIGAGAMSSTIEEDERVLMKKYNLNKRKVHVSILALISCMHYVLFDEVEVVAKELKKEDSENFKKKASFVSKILERDPSIRDSFYTYHFSKIPFFAGIDWEAEIKVFHSPHEFIVEHPPIPVGRIQIQMRVPSQYPPKPSSVEFEISSKDVEIMINYLKDLQKALENLRTAKIVPKE